jgi:L-malate glycosyltransferase
MTAAKQFDSLHIIGSVPSGGAERFYSRLVCSLAEAGHRTLAVNQAGSAVSQQIGAVANQEHVRMRGVWDRFARWRLARLVDKTRPKIVQTYMGRATRIYRTPSDSSAVHVARLGGFYEVGAYKHAHAWVGNSKGICDHLVRGGMPASQVFHIGNFVDMHEDLEPQSRDQVRAAHGLKDSEFVVLFVGRLSHNKGVPDLLQAVALLPSEVAGRPVKVLLAGDGPERGRLEKLAAELGISERLVFTGWIDDPALCYGSADLFVCPSVHEPLGNVVLEAWSHRLPVVSTRSQGPSEYMHDGEDGWMVPIGDPGAMASAIVDALAASDATRRAMGEAGRAQVEQHHSRDGVTAQYLELYASLSAGR